MYVYDIKLRVFIKTVRFSSSYVNDFLSPFSLLLNPGDDSSPMSYTYWDGQQNIEILDAAEEARSQLHVL